ncbi:poly-gamma-glutamate hydrolase family protein [Saccharopolyspora spinosporotrichia]
MNQLAKRLPRECGWESTPDGHLFRPVFRPGPRTPTRRTPRFTRTRRWFTAPTTASGTGGTARLPLRPSSPRTEEIEAGTSELCLAIATWPDGAAFDYWAFEGLRSPSALHVTSTRCDDPLALSLCARSPCALSLHGCRAEQTGTDRDAQSVLVGGRDGTTRHHLIRELRRAGFDATDASSHGVLSGMSPANICNRTRRGRGSQLEITTPLLDAMFTSNTIEGRKHTRTPVFWAFVAAVRAAFLQ